MSFPATQGPGSPQWSSVVSRSSVDEYQATISPIETGSIISIASTALTGTERVNQQTETSSSDSRIDHRESQNDLFELTPSLDILNSGQQYLLENSLDFDLTGNLDPLDNTWISYLSLNTPNVEQINHSFDSTPSAQPSRLQHLSALLFPYSSNPISKSSDAISELNKVSRSVTPVR